MCDLLSFNRSLFDSWIKSRIWSWLSIHPYILHPLINNLRLADPHRRHSVRVVALELIFNFRLRVILVLLAEVVLHVDLLAVQMLSQLVDCLVVLVLVSSQLLQLRVKVVHHPIVVLLLRPELLLEFVDLVLNPDFI